MAKQKSKKENKNPIKEEIVENNEIDLEDTDSTESNDSSVESYALRDKGVTPLKKYLKFFVIAFILIAVGLAGYLLKDSFVVATVNGTPITRAKLWKSLEGQYGKQTVQDLVTQELIAQEAVKRNVVVSVQDIDSEIQAISQNIEAQGATLQQALEAQGMTMDDLRDQIEVQKKLEAMVAERAKVSDEEIAQAVASLVENGQEDTEQLREGVRQQITQAKLQQEIQAFLNEIRTAANVSVSSKFE